MTNIPELIARLRSWRPTLAEIGGYDNELVGVPAGGVRHIVYDCEMAALALEQLQARVEALQYMVAGMEKELYGEPNPWRYGKNQVQVEDTNAAMASPAPGEK